MTCGTDGSCLSCEDGLYLDEGKCLEPMTLSVSYDFDDQYLNLYKN